MRAGVAVGAVAAFALGCGVAAASDGAHQETGSAAAGRQNAGDLRARLEQAGLQFTFTYYGDAFANPVGGVKQGLGYDGRFGTIIDGDLEKLAGWTGARFHASIHAIRGTQFSATNLQNLMTVSGIEAPPSFRLFNLWIEQKFGRDLSLRVGQYTAAQEFLVSQNANLFVNSTFGWPVLPAQDLPSGGPAYPEATPGARLSYAPNDRLTVRAAIFDGDPAGPGPGNPVERDPFGVAFRVRDPPLLIAEVAYAYNEATPAAAPANPHQEGGAGGANAARRRHSGAGLPGTIKFGAWVHTGDFADQRFNVQGGLLAASSVPPLQHRGDVAVYAVLDQMLWRVGGDSDRGLNFFLRASAAPSDRNPVDLYVDSGLTFNGPFDARPDDTLGLGIAYGRVSSRAAARDRDAAALSGETLPIRDFEAAVELTYQFQMTNAWSLQPDIQYLVHPGANVPNPASTSGAPVPDALVLGLRTVMKF